MPSILSPALKSRMEPTNTAAAPQSPARDMRSSCSRSSRQGSKVSGRSSMRKISASGHHREKRHFIVISDSDIVLRVLHVDRGQHAEGAFLVIGCNLPDIRNLHVRHIFNRGRADPHGLAQIGKKLY